MITCTTDIVARVESLRGMISEAGRQVNGLFESLLSESFDKQLLHME